MVVAVEDPRSADVVALLEVHLEFARGTSPLCHVHALDLEQLLDASVTFFTAREGDKLLGVGALKKHNKDLFEIKSMHTSVSARGRGVGRAIVGRLVEFARDAGATHVGLETGTQPGFAAARALYESVGFNTCPPFGQYAVNSFSVCMSLEL